MVADQVSIDMPAGPSEVYVVSDDIERADIIASDLLSQLEHSNDAKAVFISKNKELTARVITSINIQKKELKRQEILKNSIKNIRLINTKTNKQIIDFINTNAPEHLILLDNNFSDFIPSIINAGSVFLWVIFTRVFW